MSWVDVVEVKTQLPQPNFTFSVSLGAVENREAEAVEVASAAATTLAAIMVIMEKTGT